MKIGVLSDTHDSLPAQVLEAMREADEIWHLGDVTRPFILSSLQDLGIPLQVVAGNCDHNVEWPETLRLERMGIRFYLIHIPLYRAPEGVDVLLHGHTHMPRDEMIEGCRFMNPGAVAGSYKGSPHGFAMMTLSETGSIGWERLEL
ncbi:MAG: metallophosphoesterase family protein [Verrucomicrobiota bacterium]